MEVGSLVELLPRKIVTVAPNGVIFPQHNVIYTVRDIEPPNNLSCQCILLEEIINPKAANGREYSFAIFCFRELQPPMEAEIKELLKEPKYV